MSEGTARELLALTEELVSIDSVNPALDSSRAGEREIALFVGRWAEERGLQVRWLEPVAGRPSVIVRASGSGGGRTLMLNAHLDTVGVTDMDSPFEPRLEHGRLLGRGVMDMKGSLAVCMVTLARAHRRSLRGDVVLIAVADEEHGSIGTEAALREVEADAAIVTEPTDLEMHVAHRGFSVFETTFAGKASHTSRPEAGVNALTHLGRLLREVERHDRELRERPPHPLLAHGTLQAVLASGGHELFTTPAFASATLERRTVPGENAASAAAELQELLDRLTDEDETVRTNVQTLVAREPFETPAGTEIEAELAKAVLRVRGCEPRRLGAPYWTDAALVGAAGIPTVLFGPTGGDIHQPTEWLETGSLEVMLGALELVIESFCS